MSFSLHMILVLAVYIVGCQTVLGYPSSEAGLGRLETVEEVVITGSRGSLIGAAKLSTSCQMAAAGLLASEFGTCANILELVSIFDTKESLVSPINTWVSSTCSAKPCGKEGLAAASQMIRTGCQTDLEEGSIAAVALYSIITHYKEARNMFCTQYKENLQFCLPSVLGRVEAQSGEKITIGEVMSLIAGKFTPADLAFISVPETVYCNACGHAIVSQSAAMIEAVHKDPAGIRFDYTSGQTVHLISDICGSSFEEKALHSSVQIAPPPFEN